LGKPPPAFMCMDLNKVDPTSVFRYEEDHRKYI